MSVGYPILKIRIVAIVAALVFAMAGCVAAEDSVAPSEQAIQKLIQRLGATNFVAREDASRRLLQLGVAAEAPLAAASESSDREVRDRSTRILNLIRKRKRTVELAAFRVGNADQQPAFYVPGWKQFTARYGNDDVSRQVFAQMLAAEWTLLLNSYPESGEQQTEDSEKLPIGRLATEQADENPNALPPIRRLVTQRFSRLFQLGRGHQSYNLGTILTFITLASERPDDFSLHGQLYNFLGHPQLQPLLATITKDGERNDRSLIRKMVGDWLVAAGPHISDRQGLQISLQYRMHEVGSIIAKRVLNDGAAPPMSKSTAMQAIVIRNDTSQIPLVEPFLNDTTELSKTGNRVRQLRDVALASLMSLHGHDVKLIGVKPLPNSSHSAFDYGTLGFISESDRDKAFAKFRELQKAKAKGSRKGE